MQYHVSLNGQGYVLDLDRYQKRIREPFPSKQTEGSLDFSDLRGTEQLLAISDWSGGEGELQHSGTVIRASPRSRATARWLAPDRKRWIRSRR